MSAAPGAAPARPRRTGLIALGVAALLVLAVVVVLVARLIRGLPSVQGFLAAYPGAAPLPAGAPVGFPAWVAWQHGLNALFMLFVIRSGLRLHAGGRPSTFWTRRNTGRIRTANAPVRIGIDLWSHYVGDVLWVLNGALFVVLLFSTGQWLRIVPTSWAIVPAALSSALQYASLDWPTANGWIDYNALQALSYFAVTFVAGPVSVLTGLRAAPGFATRLRPLDRVLPLRATKRLHYWTTLFFVAFIAVHVGLVFATGAIRNLNHMYALRDDSNPIGLVVLVVSLIATAALVLAARATVVKRVAALAGTVLERPARRQR